MFKIKNKSEMNCKLSKLFFIALTLGVTYSGKAQTEEERKTIVKEYDIKALQNFAKENQEKFEAEYRRAVEYAKQNNLPIKGVDKNNNNFELVGFIPGTTNLKYYTTANNGPTGSIRTAQANEIKQGGALGLNLEGQGMIVGIWDGGQPLASHQSLGVDRVTSKDNTTGSALHATHVAGTMVSKGVVLETKGFASEALLWANDWFGDRAEMTTQAGQGLLISNHSYGIQYGPANFHNNPAALGQYNGDARSLDQLLFNVPNYLPVYAAGNDRAGGPENGNQGGDWVIFNAAKKGADLLYGEGVSKNNVVVAAVEGIASYTGPDVVMMSSFSNWGPSDDYRIKPDISAKGVNVLSLSNASTTATHPDSGTSMAAPAVAGVFTLWQQYYKQLWPTRVNMKSATVKALMAATAVEAGKYRDPNTNTLTTSGEGPDHRFGWGLINAYGGAQVLKAAKANEALVVETNLVNGQTYEVTFTIPENAELKPLIATIAWTDPAGTIGGGGDSSSPALVNDLDLRIIRSNGQEVLPWKLNKNWSDMYALRGDNDVDNIEKVEYKGAASGVAAPGEYTIRVTHKGTLTGGNQNFSLIVYSGVGSASSKDFKFEGVEVYPNPTSDYVNILDDKGSLLGGSAIIYDMQGKKLDVVHNFSGSTTKIDVSRYSKGVYFMELNNNGQKQIVKIIRK